MGMIGNPADASFRRVSNDSYNGDGSTTTFTLSAEVAANTDIEVLVDNVQQSPYDGSYSAVGTTLTFSEAPGSGTNNIYVIYNIGHTFVTNTVGADNIQDGAVSAAKLADTYLTEIADGSITSAKLDTSYVPTAGGTMTGNLTAPGITLDSTTATKHSHIILSEVDTTGSFSQVDISISPSYSGFSHYKVVVSHWHLAADGELWCTYEYGGTKKGGWYGGYYRVGEANSSGNEGYSNQAQCELIGTNTTSHLSNRYCFKGEFDLWPLGNGSAVDFPSGISWLGQCRLAVGSSQLIVGSALTTDGNLPDKFVLYSNQATTAIRYTLIGVNP